MNKRMSARGGSASGGKKITINQKEIKKDEIDLIVDYLKQGKVIVYPTDTIYGLGCIATNINAINKIYKIKKRDKKKPLLILVSSLAMVNKYCYVSKKQEEYLKKIWNIKSPQPHLLKGALKIPPTPFVKGAKKAVSVILKSRGLLPKNLTGGSDSVAVRLPSSQILIKIIRQVGFPIVSTSVNISGKNNLTNIRDIDGYFVKYKPDLVVDTGKISGKSSKLIDLRDINNKLVIRN